MSKKNKVQKTNVMRILDKNNMTYETIMYECEDFIDACHIADKCGIPYENSYKTLVLKGKSNNYYVFVLQADKEIDLKKAAFIAKEKSLEMVAVKEINKITGYVRGGVSPIGMKKNFKTFISEKINNLDYIVFSGGKKGVSIRCSLESLIKITSGKVSDFERI